MTGLTLALGLALLFVALAAARDAPGLERWIRPAVGGIATVALVALVAWSMVRPDGGFRWDERLERLERVADMRVADRAGREIGYAVKHEWVGLDALPPYVPAAFIAVEDQRFWRHPGVDPVGAARAGFHNLTRLPGRLLGRDGGWQGASGIPMQAVRMMDPDSVLWPDHTLGGKLAESLAAMDLVAHADRRRILEAYLNTLYLGGLTRGIEAGALHHFGCRARELSMAQAAMLAGLTRAPNTLAPGREPPAARLARDHALDRILAEHPEWAREVEAARREPLGRRCRREGVRPRGDDVLRAARAALRTGEVDTVAVLATTIDLPLQASAERHVIEAARRIERGGHGRYVVDPADRLQMGYVALDAETGAIRALVCGRPDLPYRWDYCTRARIRVNSVIKPFLLACALESDAVTLDTPLAALERRAGYPHRSDGWMAARRAESRGGTVRAALWRSDPYLGPLLWTVATVDCMERLRELQVVDRPWEPTESYGLATLAPIRLAAAFAALVNGGRVNEPALFGSLRSRPTTDDRRPTTTGGAAIPADTTSGAGSASDTGEAGLPADDGVRVFPSAVADAVRDGLRGVVHRPEGTASSIGWFFEAEDGVVAKTGTAQDWQDLVLAGHVPETGVVAVLFAFHERPRRIVEGGFAGELLGPAWGRIARDHLDSRKVAGER